MFCLLSMPSFGAEPGPHPNILFIVADQWRAAATGYAGDPNLKTPNLDRLESQSINFTHAVSTCPVCSPFRATLLTGQRATTHGVFLNDAHLSNDAVSIAKVLNAAGYETAWIGKWHVNGHGRLSFIPREDRQGFDYWKVCECTHDYNHSFYFADTSERLLWPGYDAFAQADDAKTYLKGHAKTGKPFAMFLAWGPPHNPYQSAPEKFAKMYSPADITLRPNVPEVEVKSARKDLAGYYAQCSALDQSTGELCQALADLKLDQNTILVFTSDHGDMLGSHGMERKQKPWDESIRIPMLFRYPAALGDKGKRSDAMIGSEDLMPTLLGLCHVAIPSSVEGLDFSGYLRGGENPKPDNAALIECVVPFGEWNRLVGGKEYRGIRTLRFTYVRDLKGPWLLYDNERDPYQNENLVGKPEAVAIQAELDGILTRHLAAAHDDFSPAHVYLDKWGYSQHVDRTGTLPTKP
jgi:arylsulfatase A-like enzyme